MARRNTEGTDVRPFRKFEVTDPALNAAVTTDILDTYSLIIITTSGASNAQTLASPSVVANSTRITIANNDISTDAITINGTSLAVGTVIEFVWEGTIWATEGASASGDTLPIVDTTPIVKGSVDATKLVRIEADGITTGTTRVITMPDEDITLVDKANVLELDNTTVFTPDADYEPATKKYVDDNAGGGGTSIIINGRGATSIVAPNTRYIPLGGNFVETTEAVSNTPIPKAGTLQNLRVNIPSNSTTNAATFTLRKNNASTGITFTITAGTPGLYTDLVNTVSVIAGDLLCFEILATSGTGTIAGFNYSMELA